MYPGSQSEFGEMRFTAKLTHQLTTYNGQLALVQISKISENDLMWYNKSKTIKPDTK